MSAFVCGPDHIKTLAAYAASNGKHTDRPRVDPRFVKKLEGYPPETAERVVLAEFYANTLYEWNVRSVACRYPDDDFDGLPGPCDKPRSLRLSWRDTKAALDLSPVALLEMCDCLEYQSCEFEGWDDDPAYHLLDRIRRAAIRDLPESGTRTWEYNHPPKEE